MGRRHNGDTYDTDAKTIRAGHYGTGQHEVMLIAQLPDESGLLRAFLNFGIGYKGCVQRTAYVLSLKSVFLGVS